jgi:CRISPR-associated protein Cas2
MLVVSYDISDNKLRTKFAKTLIKQGGIRLQYSVFEINNSKRVLDNLIIRLDNYYAKKFGGGDSVFIFTTDEYTVRARRAHTYLSSSLRLLYKAWHTTIRLRRRQTLFLSKSIIDCLPATQAWVTSGFSSIQYA